MKCELILKDIDPTLLTAIPVLAQLLDRQGEVRDGDGVLLRGEVIEAVQYVLDSTRTYMNLQFEEAQTGDCAVDRKDQAYLSAALEQIVMAQEALANQPEYTEADWQEVDAICRVPSEDDNA